jgi:hypothetical protein
MLWAVYHRKLLSLAQHRTSLTDSQRDAFQAIVDLIEHHEQRINLWGNPGVGKTFVAHCLYHHAEGLYVSSTKNYKAFEMSPDSVVIFDNAPHERKFARLIFGDKLWTGAAAVILITRQPIKDAIRKVQLSLEFKELEQVKRNICQQLDLSPVELPNEYDFQETGIWKIVKNISYDTLVQPEGEPIWD